MYHVDSKSTRNWDEMFEKASGIWNERLKEAMRPRGSRKKLTQSKLAKIMRERYGECADEDSGTRGKRQFTQQDVSNWLNVGDSKSKKGEQRADTRGFPKMETAIMLADCLSVDVGYLLGETDCCSFSQEKAADYLGIEPEAIASIRGLTTDADGDRGPMEKDFSTIISRFVSARGFPDFILSLLDIEVAAKGLEELIESNVEDSELDSHIDEEIQRFYELKTYRYEAFESFVAIVQELWPILNRLDRYGVRHS